ncbi:MAG TPA: hypothetical protein VJ021_04780 [Thermoplasmata archaeon]|nr:hypothetical protein [Thermoplasmata archaeon]
MSAPRVFEARAFAPGHVTGVFRPDASQRDPRARGSVGAGLVLELGVWGKARFSPGPRSRVRVVADSRTPLPISEEVARRLAPEASGTLTVRLTHELPIGQGFGMSAAGALATALAVGSLSGRPRSKAIEVAHLADLFGGGGLGGVAAILGGGLEVRTRPGIPPFGHVTHRSFSPALLVGVFGRPISSPSVLRDVSALRRIVTASRGWQRLGQDPSTLGFFRMSERFTDQAGLASAAVRRTVAALRRRGAFTCQAMFGQSFFAFPRSPGARTACLDWLQGEGIHTVELHASATGARVARTLPA